MSFSSHSSFHLSFVGSICFPTTQTQEVEVSPHTRQKHQRMHMEQHWLLFSLHIVHQFPLMLHLMNMELLLLQFTPPTVQLPKWWDHLLPTTNRRLPHPTLHHHLHLTVNQLKQLLHTVSLQSHFHLINPKSPAYHTVHPQVIFSEQILSPQNRSLFNEWFNQTQDIPYNR